MNISRNQKLVAASFLFGLLTYGVLMAANDAAPERDGVPDRHRAALVLIEFQNEWLAEDGTLRFLMEDEAQFHSAIEAGRQALEVARRHNMPIVHVGLRFKPGYPEMRPAEHGLRAAIPRIGTWQIGTKGAEFHPDFRPLPGEFVVSGRNGASGFAGSDLDAYLKAQGIETLYLAGFALHVCVESTLREAHDRGYAPVLLQDATSAFTAQQRAHVLQDVVHHFGESVDNRTFRQRAQSIAPVRARSDADDSAAAWGNLDEFARINEKYQLDMDFGSVPKLCEQFGLTFPQL
jgi:nicotinamidase-related amidase